MAAVSAIGAILVERQLPGAWRDFDVLWLAGRALLAGDDPYRVVAEHPWPWPLYHPLPAVVVDLPFAFLPRQAARILFTACAGGLLAFAVTRTTWWPLMFVVTAPFRHVIHTGQWSPILVAATLMPAIGGLLVVKPNMGLALFASRPHRSAVVGGALLLAISLAIWPGWPVSWWREATQLTHLPPVVRPGGALLLLALLRSRTPEGRLLAALAVIPHRPVGYDMLPVLLLIPRTWKEMAILAAGCEIAFRLASRLPETMHIDAFDAASWTVFLAFVYIPALIIVLLRPARGASEHRSREG